MRRIALMILLFGVVLSGCSELTEFAIDTAVQGVIEIAMDANYSNPTYDPYGEYEKMSDNIAEVELFTCTDNWCQPIAEPAINIEYYTCSDNWCRPTVGSSAIDT